jgi:DNA-binding NtrC family response regulator
VQAKLLRFLETGECQQLGQPVTRQVDVRVIAATNRDLDKAVEEGTFRRDLYYRLYVVPLELPPLRKRQGDIELMLNGLTQELSVEYDLAAPRYSRSALRLLNRYRWPGNVRELKNLCERMLILFSGRNVEADNLPMEIRQGQIENRPEADGFRLPDRGLSLDDLEADLIRQALDRALGNRSKAARLLGLSRDTLLYRIKKYAIEY